MANKRIWDEELDDLLYEFVKEGRKNELTISRISENFSLVHPGFTKEQIRSRFYQLVKDREVEDYISVVKPWTDEDDDYIFSFVRKHKNEMNKTIMFDLIGKTLGRDAQHIASRYYKLKKKSKEEMEAKVFLEKIANIDESKAERFIKMLSEFSEVDREKMEAENKKLKDELEKVNRERDILRNRLSERNERNLKKKLIEI